MSRNILKLIAVSIAVLMVVCVLPFASAEETECEHVAAAAVVENEIAPTCTTSGSYDEVVYCENCGEKLSVNHVAVTLLGHTDEDGNKICDDCKMELTSLTTGEPDKDKCPLCGITGHTGVKNEGLGIITAEGGLLCWFYRIASFVIGGAEFGDNVSVFKWFPLPI